MTIQERILNAVEALVANESPYVMVVVEYSNHLDCGCVDWVTISHDEMWSINSKGLNTPNGYVDFKEDHNITVELCKFCYNDNGQKYIGDAIAKF